MIQTQGLTHIHLMVGDLERSLRFYQGVFGMRELFRDGEAMVFLNTPGSRDSITLNEDAAISDEVRQKRRRSPHRLPAGKQVRS
jgi:catechol 2,3-dioxygenase-like lactoylglutathione lyase family enzyme